MYYLNLPQESVEPDPDSEQYSVHQFKVNGKLSYSHDTQLDLKIQELLHAKKIKACTGSKEKTPICVTGNGTVNTNIQLEENMKGYISIPLLVKDAAGNSTTELRVCKQYAENTVSVNLLAMNDDRFIMKLFCKLNLRSMEELTMLSILQ